MIRSFRLLRVFFGMEGILAEYGWLQYIMMLIEKNVHGPNTAKVEEKKTNLDVDLMYGVSPFPLAATRITKA